MRALVLREQGPEAWPGLETDFPDPVVGEGDVLVKVRATSLNYHDVFTRRGMPGIKIALPVILGPGLRRRDRRTSGLEWRAGRWATAS